MQHSSADRTCCCTRRVSVTLSIYAALVASAVTAAGSALVMKTTPADLNRNGLSAE